MASKDAVGVDTAQRAVLRPTVTRDDLDDALVAGGWRLVNVVEGVVGRPSQLIFSRDAGASYVHVIDDLRLGVTYLTASSAPGVAPDAATILEELRAALPCHPPNAHEALLATLGDDGGEGQVSDVALGLALLVLQGPVSAEGDAALSRALAHPDARVRGAALVAVTYRPRPNALPRLLAIQTGDEEPGLREAAGQVIAACYGGGA